MTDEEMTAYFTQCLISPNMPRQSIETLLHGFIPAAHTDHTHPDAVISLACSSDGKKWMREIYGDRAAWVDYIRPGSPFPNKSVWPSEIIPQIECVVMGKHGLVTWGDEPKATYSHTISIIQEAEDFIAVAPNKTRVWRGLDVALRCRRTP